MDAYHDAFESSKFDEPFLTTYTIDGKSLVVQERLTRHEFLVQAQLAAYMLESLGIGTGDCHIHYFSGNNKYDLILRMAAVLIGSVPVTINWDADTPERAVYKVKATSSRVVFIDDGVPKSALDQIEAETSAKVAKAASALSSALAARIDKEQLPLTGYPSYWSSSGNPTSTAAVTAGVERRYAEVATMTDETRIIIFTSGTTGMPKGVKLPYRAYRANRATFEDFLHVPAEGDAGTFAVILANPLHHTNSTAISDWALRRPGAEIHLLPRYTTQYWALLVAVAAGVPLGDPALAEDGAAARELIAARAAAGCRVVCPLVSRHFDFLDALMKAGELPVAPPLLRAATSAASAAGIELVTLLLGSAPVGPTTVERLVAHCGTLPTVRFGSTETCLQVMGTPLVARAAGDDGLAARRRPFERGWAHEWKGVPTCGYYIGRAHPPHTEVRVVKSAKIGAEGYLEACAEGEPGQIVTRGANVMSAYVNNADATAAAIDAAAGGWYLKLGDVGFWLAADDGGRDHYWLARDSALLIRGGANYAYEQINAELTAWAATHYATAEVEVSVIGLRVESEHEDACLATIEFRGAAAQKMPMGDGAAEAAAAFVAAARAAVSKGAKPDRARFAPIPKNFKGAVLVPELVSTWKAALGL